MVPKRVLTTVVAVLMGVAVVIADNPMCSTYTSPGCTSSTPYTLSYKQCSTTCGATCCSEKYKAGATCGNTLAAATEPKAPFDDLKCQNTITKKRYDLSKADVLIDAFVKEEDTVNACCAPTCATAGAGGVPYACEVGTLLRMNAGDITINSANLAYAQSLCCVTRTCAKLELNSNNDGYTSFDCATPGKLPATPSPVVPTGAGTENDCCVPKTCANSGVNNTPWPCTADQFKKTLKYPAPAVTVQNQASDAVCCYDNICRDTDCTGGYVKKANPGAKPDGGATEIRTACCDQGTLCSKAGPLFGGQNWFQCSSSQTRKSPEGSIPSAVTAWKDQAPYCCTPDAGTTCANVASGGSGYACSGATVLISNAANIPILTGDTNEQQQTKCCEAATRTCGAFSNSQPFPDCLRGKTIPDGNKGKKVADSITDLDAISDICCTGGAISKCENHTSLYKQDNSIFTCPPGKDWELDTSKVVLRASTTDAELATKCCADAKKCGTVRPGDTAYVCARGQTPKNPLTMVPNSALATDSTIALACCVGTAVTCDSGNSLLRTDDSVFTCPVGKDWNQSTKKSPVPLGSTDAQVEALCCKVAPTCKNFESSNPFPCLLGTTLKLDAEFRTITSGVAPASYCCDGTARDCSTAKLSSALPGAAAGITCSRPYANKGNTAAETKIPGDVTTDEDLQNTCCVKTCLAVNMGISSSPHVCPWPTQPINGNDNYKIPNGALTATQQDLCCAPITCATVIGDDGSHYKCPIGKSYRPDYATTAIPRTATTNFTAAADLEAACCVSCSGDTFTDKIGEAVCRSQCPVANQVPRPDKTGCQCPAGYAWTPAADGQEAKCEPCPAKTYNDAIGTGSATTCKPCPYANQVSSSDKLKCVCPQGYGWNATTTQCTKCGVGEYSNQPDSACQKAACAKPKVVSADGIGCICGEGFVEGLLAGTCVCPAGNHYNATLNTCTPCEGDKYSAQANSECRLCDKPRAVGRDRTSCLCGNNFEDNAGTCTCPAGFGYTNASKSCTLCDVGTYSTGANSQCKASCDKPNQQIRADRKGCECAANFLGTTDCVCPKGYAYTPSSVTGKPGTCSLCTGTTCNPIAPASATTATTCKPCEIPGQVSSSDGRSCVCPRGAYMKDSKTCTQCPANQYNDHVDQTACKNATDCPDGKTMAADQTGCTCDQGFIDAGNDNCVCPAGFAYMPPNVTGKTPAKCTACADDQVNPLRGSGDAATYCRPCDQPLKANDDNSACVCPAPFKTQQSSSLSDVVCVCPEGHAYDATTKTCELCGPGSYNDKASSTDTTTCKTVCVNIGEVIKADRTGCECAAPFLPLGGGQGCKCPAGHDFDAVEGTCKECDDGFVNSMIGTTKSTFCTQCSTPGFTLSNTAKTACECPAGYAFTAATASTPAACEKCADGTYSDQSSSPDSTTSTTCRACPAPYVLSDDLTSCTCSQGYHLDPASKQCLPCSIGTYAPKSISNITQCSPCAAPRKLAEDQASCTCPAGFYLNDKQCMQCPAGTYSDVTGASSCKVCEASHQLASDQSSCKCASGYYENSDGQCVVLPVQATPSPTPSPQQGTGEVVPSPSPSPSPSAIPANVTTATSTYKLSFPLDPSTSFEQLKQSNKLDDFKAKLIKAIALKAGVPEQYVTISSLREGSIVAEVAITAPVSADSQAAVTDALVSNPSTLFENTGLEMRDFGITAVAGEMLSTTLVGDCSRPLKIGVGVGVGVGGALGLAGFGTAFVVYRRSKHAVGIA